MAFPPVPKPTAQGMTSWLQLGPGGACPRAPGASVLDHAVDLSPLVDVLLADDVRVDEQVPVPHAEVLLAGSTLEALEVIDLVLHPHGHLVGADPLLAGGAQPVLAKEPAATAQRSAWLPAWAKPNQNQGKHP